MKDQKDLDTGLMFEQACAFVDCALSLETEPNKIMQRTRSHFYANLSLSALACEIFIKCLIIQKGGTYKKNHQLDKLWKVYKELDQKEAQEIEQSIKDWFNSRNDNLFEEMITEAAKAFEQWRYVFDYDEKDGIKVNPQFLRGFRTILRGVTCVELGEGLDSESIT